MKTVDEELKPETVETSNLRGDIGFLLKDEVEAIDGYDKVLNRADLDEEQRNTLEELRNDELDHVNKLNEIYRTLATGDIEEDNDLVEYNKDSRIVDVKSTELVEHIRDLFRRVSKSDIDRFKEELKNKGEYRDLGTRLAWGVLYNVVKKAGEHISDFYDKYDVNDDHITTAAKKVLREMGVQLNDSINDEEFTGAGYEEANVNEPLNPMCDKVEDGIFESILNAGTNAFRGLSNASKIDSKPEKIKDAETTESAANNSGRIALGNKYHWEKKYADRTLTISKIKKENLKLELNNTTYVIIPIDKFYTMLNMGEITPVSTVDINGYDDVKTTRNYKVNVGDKTYVVNAKSAKDAKFKIKRYRENN